MRVAALFDIHGNLPALDAVLQQVAAERADRIVVGGDVFPGPMAYEALARLREVDVPVQFIYGNCEVAVLAQRATGDPGRMPEPARQAMRWTAEHLAPGDERAIAAWPKTLRVEVPGLGAVLFCHATPRNENECFTRLTPEAPLLPLFMRLDASVVVCGHTHMQFDRMIGSVRVVNAGSVGMPFGEPGAYWALLGPDVQLRRTAYDLAAAAARIRSTPYPQAEEFAEKYVLHPPSEEQMLGVFSHVELR